MKTKDKETKKADFEYEVSELLESCETITGQKREVGEGALFNAEKEKMTIEEFKKTVNDFLKREVK